MDFRDGSEADIFYQLKVFQIVLCSRFAKVQFDELGFRNQGVSFLAHTLELDQRFHEKTRQDFLDDFVTEE